MRYLFIFIATVSIGSLQFIEFSEAKRTGRKFPYSALARCFASCDAKYPRSRYKGLHRRCVNSCYRRYGRR